MIVTKFDLKVTKFTKTCKEMTAKLLHLLRISKYIIKLLKAVQSDIPGDRYQV